jgi:hypothetical protein
MALLQRTRTLSQQRIDLPDYRAIEDFVCADFKAIHKNVWTNQNFVFSGFESSGTGTTDLNIVIDGSSLIVGQNDGVLYIGAPSLSDIVTDALTPAATNYVELIVEQDTGGADSRAFWDQTAGGGAGGEFSQIVDTFIFNKVSARINTSSFTGDADKVKVCEVDVNGSGIITAIRDRRDLFWRLGRGTQPNFAYSWASRTEPVNTQFTGADKDIATMKNWVDAVMDSIRELKGTTYWYELAGSSLVGSFRNVALSFVTALGNNVSWKWSGTQLSLQDDALTPVSTDTLAAIRLFDSASNILLTRQQTGQEVQKITFSAIPDAGNFTLEHNGNTTAAIAFNASPAAILAACNLAFVSQLASVSGDFSNGFTFTFLTAGNVVAITEASNTLTKLAVAVTTTISTIQNGFTGSSAITLADGEIVWVELPDPLANTTITGIGVTATNFKISARGSVPNNDNTFWLAYREGSNLYIRNHGELEPGETAEISDNINENILQAIGIPTETSLPQYASNNIVADNDSLVLAVSKLDAAAGIAGIGSNQDRSMKLIEGGTWSVDFAGTNLAWSADAFIDVPEVTRVSNRILAGNVTLPNANSVAYVEINRASGPATLTVNVADVDALTPTPNTVIIARRVTAGILVGQHSFLLKATEFLELDGALADINRRLTQLKLHKHESANNKARVLAADFTQLDADILSQVVGEFILSFTGAVINFTSGAILKEDDVTALGINFTPFTIPVGQYFWYGVSLIPGNVLADNRQEAQVQIDFGDSANAVQASAPLPVITGDIKLGAIQVLNNAGTIEIVQTRRLGVGSGSGSGSGDASSLDTLLRDRFAVNSFELMDQNIFRKDKATKIDLSSTGAYSPAKRAFAWTAIGQTMVSQDVLDQSFLDEGVDITEAELYLTYLTGFVDAAATYEISRDGGTNWQTMTMEQIGLNAFRGYHVFSEEVSNQALQTVAASGAGQSLNATTRQELSSQLALSTTSVVKTVDLNLNYGGVGTGLVTLRLVKNNAGVPSTAVADIISESDAKIISSASLGGTGDLTVTFNLPDVVLTAGTYHLVLVTDAGYKAGTLDLSWRNGAGTNGATFDGTTWTGAASTKAAVVSGRAHDLVVRVTSSVALAYAEGYGLYYGLTNGVTSATGEKRFQKFYFTGDSNTTDFLLTFTPDPELLEILDPYRGQAYAIEEGVARIEGQTVKFEPDTFDFPGEDIVLIFRQTKGSVIDNSDSNAAAISEIQSNLIDIGDELASISDSMILPKIVVPNTTILNRATIPDLAQDLKPRFSVERIQTQQIYQLQDEVGPNGEQVFGVVNDKFNQIRCVGSWSNFNTSTTGILIQTSEINSYIEITFYGTGLNLVTVVRNTARNIVASVDGGSPGSNLFPTLASDVLLSRNYSSNQIVSVVSGLSLGVHTVKLNNVTATTFPVHGFEVLNENASGLIQLPPGAQLYKGKKRTHTILETTAYNSGFETGTLGTRGGRVLVYQKADGSVAKAVTPTNASQLNLASANHSNEEIARKYNFREFGAGRADDFSSLVGTVTDRAFTLDDGTTTLTGNDVAVVNTLAIETLNAQALNAFITLTFVGTGLDVVKLNSAAGTTDTYQVYVDGTLVGTLDTTSDTSIRTVKLVSGLSYGTHTVRILRTTFVAPAITFANFIVYQPKTPTLPTGAVEIGAYNIMANFDGTAATGTTEVLNAQTPTGVLYKNASRESVYVGANWAFSPLTFAPNASLSTFTTAASAQYVEYTFVGTGVSLHFLSSVAGNYTATVELVGEATPTVTPRANCTGGSGTLTTTTGVTPALPVRAEITGLSFKDHTIRVTKFSGAGNMAVTAFNVITPIHSHQNNGPFILQNTLSVGSQGIADLRKFSKKDVPTTAIVAQASNIVATPSVSTATGTYIPYPDLSVTIKTTGKPVMLQFHSAQTVTASQTCQIAFFVDGKEVGASIIWGTGAGANMAPIMSGTAVIPMSAGYHKIDVYWSGVASSGSDRQLTAREMEN